MPSEVVRNWATAAQAARRPDRDGAGWSCLERFLSERDGAGEADRQTRTLVDAVLALTGAETVAYVPAAADEPVAVAGGYRLDDAYCRRLIDRLVDTGPSAENRFWSQMLAPAAAEELFQGIAGPAPTGLAVGRVGRTRPAWVAALTFSPTRRLEPGSAAALRLAVRMLRNRRRRDQQAGDLSGSRSPR